MKRSLLFLGTLLMFLSSFAQQGSREYSGFFDSYYYKGKRNLGFSLNGGLAFYRGDLCETCLKPDMSFGVGVNYKIWPRVLFGAEFHYIKLSSDDDQSNRNLKFSTTNLEFIGYGRFYFVDDLVRVAADRTRAPKLVRPYFMLGAGVMNYSATTTYTKPFPPTDSIFLTKKETGGSGLGFIVPVGFGLHWRISNRTSLVTEIGYRITFTDMLDGVSQRGNPSKKDGYAVLDFKLQFNPWAPRKRKPVKTTPPAQYDGPKGTETWKTRKPEEPVKKNTYEEIPEETPTEGEELQEENTEEQLEEAPVEEEQELK